MARLGSVAKAGFYPIPAKELHLLKRYLEANKKGGRILDPCAGEGIALATLAMGLKYEAYANELHTRRSAMTAERINPLRERSMRWEDEGVIRTVNGDIAFLHVPTGSIQVGYLNPPYDYDKEFGRLELKFLKTATRWMQPGGILILVVPGTALRRKDMQDYIAAFYHDVTVKRFSNDNYEDFKQHIVFGVKNQKSRTPSEKVRKTLRGHFQDEIITEPRVTKTIDQDRDHARQAIYGPQNWPEPEPYVEMTDWRRMKSIEDEPETTYLPPVPRAGQVFIFHGNTITKEDIEMDVEVNGLHQGTELARLFTPADKSMAELEPLMPFKEGHLMRLIAAGMLDSTVLSNETEKIMLKGTPEKVEVKTTEWIAREGKPDEKKDTYTQVPAPTIMTLDDKGRIETVKNIPNFLIKWLPELTRLVEEMYPSRYKFDYAGFADAIGEKGSLYPAQKHCVAALCLQLKEKKNAILSGEMGVGKTRMGAVVSSAMGYKRTLVACPPHLVPKWIREIKEAIPGANVVHLQNITDVDHWMDLDEEEQEQYGIIKFTTARAASGWRHCFDYWRYIDDDKNREFIQRAADIEEGRPIKMLPPKEYAMWKNWQSWRALISRRGARNPTTGESIVDKKGRIIPIADLERSKVMRVEETPKKPKEFQHSRERKWHNPAWQFTRQGDPEMPTFLDHAKATKKIMLSPNGQRPTIPADRYPTRGKVRIADYIKKKYPLRIDLTIFDEIQKLKGGHSDQGMALARLAKASRHSLSMTGTIYGGKASTIFHILYRTDDKMRRDYTDEQATGKARIMARQWINDFGMYTWSETERENPASSLQSGTKTKTSSPPKEAPGSSPAMLPYLLNITVFLSLIDLGIALPEFEEHSVEIAPEGRMKDRLVDFDQTFGQKMRQRLSRGDKSLLASYLMAMIMWPDSPWRDEIITDPKTRHTPLEKVIGHIKKLRPFRPEEHGTWHPKETAMLNKTVDEVRRGRNVLILCEQTRIRDITKEWAKMLKEKGVKAVVLDSQKVPAAKREAWIAQQRKKGVQVLISHAKSVETGLDLLEYSTIMWMMINYSVYTVLQASRRSYRIGQEKKVKVYYFYYGQTMQESAVRLVAAKAAAAYQTTGDSIDDQSLAGHVVIGSVEEELLKMATSGKDSLQSEDTKSVQDYFDQANDAAKQTAKIIGGYDLSTESGKAEDAAPKIIEGEYEIADKETPEDRATEALERDRERMKKLGYAPQLFGEEDLFELLGDGYTPDLF
jgi:superfamily II DNA or RNA helicase